MNQYQSKQLQPGVKVLWDKNESDPGTVVKVTGTAVYIRWQHGQEGWVHHRDMKRADLVK